MTITLLSPAVPFRGGIAQFNHNLADALSATHDIHIFTFIHQYPKWLFPAKTQIEENHTTYTYPIYRTLTPYHPHTWKKTAKKIIEVGTKILIIQFWIPYFCPAYSAIIKYINKNSNIRVFIICHNVDFHEFWIGGATLTKALLQKADTLIALSHAVERSLIRLKLTHTVRLFHPLYTVEDALPDPAVSFAHLKINPRPTVLFFGFIKKYKGVDILLKSVPFVTNRIPDIQFVIVGEVYARNDKYRSMTISAGYENVVYRSEYVSPADVPHYFNIADVVVAPYRSATQSGIVQMAFSYKKPVIVSDVDGLKDMIEVDKNGLFFASGDEKDLAEKICLYFSKKDMFFKCMENTLNDHSWSGFSQKLSDLFYTH